MNEQNLEFKENLFGIRYYNLCIKVEIQNSNSKNMALLKFANLFACENMAFHQKLCMALSKKMKSNSHF